MAEDHSREQSLSNLTSVPQQRLMGSVTLASTRTHGMEHQRNDDLAVWDENKITDHVYKCPPHYKHYKRKITISGGLFC